ncbi:MAG: DUF4071 domain-containing protein [Deltaproteobacteria bacterium]|nr:MAG: DUF4071 domain-containing protein [Deltaproteobacteria bacterium]
MEKLVAETGGDGETFGILGRIYKDRYEQARLRNDTHAAAENHEHALRHYRSGFEKTPSDYYPGINVVTLLVQRNDAAARAELEAILPRVRAAVRARRDEAIPDFWELTAELQLAVVARDWTAADEDAQLAIAAAPSAWMLETTIRDLRRLGEQMESADRTRLEGVCTTLQSASGAAELEGV